MTPAEREALEPLAADLAAATGTTPEIAMRAIAAALETPEPIRTFGIAGAFRWWERPRRLWARRAFRRAQALERDDGPRPLTPNPSRIR